ncbi:MAG TPA: nuclear transport factor 2 family protein [Nitriliruptoraceae bacterium]|nr:nuclear transport factor 2 family protein [Nitriliruptoraceae bacterium]
MSTRRDRIAEYFRRQYDDREGTAQDNVESLFAEDLVFHLTGDKTMGRHALVALCQLLRRTRHDRVTNIAEFREDGDVTSFVLEISGTDPATGHTVSVGTRTRYRFDGDEVVEVWQEDPSQVEQAVRAAGVRL